jgi:hypothetical protein
MDMFHDFGAYKLTTAQLRRKYAAMKKKGDRFHDRYGICGGRNIEQEKADAYAFELAKRGECLVR